MEVEELFVMDSVADGVVEGVAVRLESSILPCVTMQ
jgi:hypothetical protein